MGWELFVLTGLYAVVCTLAIAGAYWFAERSVRVIQLAWHRSQRVQDEAWNAMNKERVIWITKLNALVEHNMKLSGINCESGRREIMEAQRWLEVVRQDIIKDVSRTVGDRVTASLNAWDDQNTETTRIPSLAPANDKDGFSIIPATEHEARVTPTHVKE